MTEALVSRPWIRATLLAGVALVLGVLAGRHPSYAVAAAALVIVTLLAFLAPVTHMAILLTLTSLLPYSVADSYHIGGGGAGNSGLQASDLFLLTAFLRAALVLPRLHLSRRQLATAALIVISCVFTVFEAWQGLRAGQPISEVGAEFRALGGGFAFALVAMTTLQDRGAHPRVIRALAILGLGVGVYGIGQWVTGASLSGGFGIRSGVSLTTNGVGQLEGGLFAYPVAVVLSVAALASGALRNWRSRAFVAVVLVLNVASLLLTFERGAWVATIAAVLLIAVRIGGGRRMRLLLAIAICSIVGLSTLAAVSPSTLQTAEQRLISIGQYKTDPSVRYRTVESGFVLAKIRAKPLLGWGLGDTIFWGQPWNHAPPIAQSYTHVGYLWLFWHEGILGGAMFLLLLVLSAAWPGRARAGPLVASMRIGAQATIVAILIMNLSYPAFHQGSQATYTMGFLVAYCAVPVLARRRTAADRRPAAADTLVAV